MSDISTLEKKKTVADRRSAAEFFDEVAAYSLCRDPAEREKMDDRLWNRYGVTGFVLISDMSGFSSTTRTLGICYFLGMIHRARCMVGPVVEGNGGLFLKCEADNCYAFFERADDALQTCIDLNASLRDINKNADRDGMIHLSIGVDYGKMLLVGDEDYFGDPVNTASKLGEDLAGQGETLVTNRALELAKKPPDVSCDQLVTRISGIDIQYKRLNVG